MGARILRFVAIAAVVLGSVYPLYWKSSIAWRCNRIERVSQDRLMRLVTRPASPSRARSARELILEVTPCLEHSPKRANPYMIAAAALRLLQRQDDAVALYGRALQYDRRPEVYFQLGLTYLELGRRDDALEAFVAANLFVFEPEMIREIILPELQLAVEQNVTAYYRGERKLPQVIHSPPGPGRGSS